MILRRGSKGRNEKIDFKGSQLKTNKEVLIHHSSRGERFCNLLMFLLTMSYLPQELNSSYQYGSDCILGSLKSGMISGKT